MKTLVTDTTKEVVRAFWNEAACGEKLYLGRTNSGAYDEQAKERYRLEPFIVDFADFAAWQGKRVLEIGVGLGADHERFARAGAQLGGIDLTGRAIAHTAGRLGARRLHSTLMVADAENLPFPDGSFDLVYSWGVIHHSPNTAVAAREILRVLKDGGAFRVMIYHKWSLVGLMLWLRYGLVRLRPWTSLDKIYAHYLESPGTKAFSRAEAARLFSGAADVKLRIELSEGDLLMSGAGQRHAGLVLSLARKLWPRAVISNDVRMRTMPFAVWPKRNCVSPANSNYLMLTTTMEQRRYPGHRSLAWMKYRQHKRKMCNAIGYERPLITSFFLMPLWQERPHVTDLRAVVDALCYVLSSGCQWRVLPRDFTLRSTIQGYFDRWREGRRWTWINHPLLMVAPVNRAQTRNIRTLWRCDIADVDPLPFRSASPYLRQVAVRARRWRLSWRGT